MAALPRIIDTMREKGFEFVTVSQLAKWDRDQAMPPVPAQEATPLVNRYVFFTFSWTQESLVLMFVVAIALGFGRLVVLCGLALIGRIRERRRGDPPDRENFPSLC